MTAPHTSLFQVAWVVNELEEAVRRWLATSRVGPFFIIPHAKVEKVRYRGAPATLDMSVAIAQAGPVQVELIQQHSDAPSAYRDMYASGQEGFHHLCAMTTTYDAELDRYRSEGCVPVTEGAFGDMRFSYIDTRARLGHMTEIIEERDSIKSLFKIIADASVGWDGRDPIRHL